MKPETNVETITPAAIFQYSAPRSIRLGSTFSNNDVVDQERGFTFFHKEGGDHKSHRTDELHHGWNDNNPVNLVARPLRQCGGASQTRSAHFQQKDVSASRMLESEEEQRSGTSARLRHLMMAQLVPNDISQRILYTGVANAGGTEFLSSSSTSSLSSFCPLLPPFVGTYSRPQYKSTGQPHSLMGTCCGDDTSCRPVEETVNEGLTLILPSGHHHAEAQQDYPTSTQNDDLTVSLFGQRQQLTLPPGSFLHLAGDQRDDFSSLSEEDHHADKCHEIEEYEPAPVTNGCAYSQQDGILEGNVDSFGGHDHSRRRHHKSMIGRSATIMMTTKRSSSPIGSAIDPAGALGRFVTAYGDDFCNHPHALEQQQQHDVPPSTSFEFHDDMSLSLLKNHHQCVARARTETTECEDDDSFVGGAWSPLTLSSSTSSLFGSIELPPAPSIQGNWMATTTPMATSQEEGVLVDHTNKKLEATRNKKGHSSLPLDLESSGQEGSGDSRHPTKKEPNPSVPPPGPRRRSHRRQLVEGSKEKAKNTKASCKNHHDTDHPSVVVGGKVKEGVGEEDRKKKHEEDVEIVLVGSPASTPAVNNKSDENHHELGSHSKDDGRGAAPTKKDLEQEEDEDEDVQLEQGDQWYARYQELVEYKSKHGHCNVPFRRSYKNDDEDDGIPSSSTSFLAAWVKRQRYQYKCKVRGKHSHLTDERQALLEELGFVWDSHVAAWEENFALMTEFYKQHGHCRIPIKQKELSDWAKRQRRHYKHKMKQQEDAKVQSSSSGATRTATTCTAATTSMMSQDRIRRLNEIKFQWATMTPSRRSTTPTTKAKKKKGEGPDDDGASRKSKRPRRQRSAMHQLVSV